jgi:hypothetical protein
VGVDLHRLSLGLPLPALVGILADQFLLFGVHADGSIAAGQVGGGEVVDVGELGVAVRVLGAVLLGLERRLQPVAELVEQSGYGRLARDVAKGAKALDQVAQRLRGPSQ